MNFGATNWSDNAFHGVHHEIDLTAMVDIVFNLLIFFMLTTTFFESPAIDINLPGAKTAPAEGTPRDITVSIDAAGRLYLSKNSISLSELDASLDELAHGAQPGTLVIRADEKTAHGQVVEVMDHAHQRGITKIAIATAPHTERP